MAGRPKFVAACGVEEIVHMHSNRLELGDTSRVLAA